MKLQEEMFQLIEGWKESKMTKTAFINGKNISLDKFNYWIHKYNDQEGKLTKNKYPAQKSLTNGDYRKFVIDEPFRPNYFRIPQKHLLSNGEILNNNFIKKTFGTCLIFPSSFNEIFFIRKISAILPRASQN